MKTEPKLSSKMIPSPCHMPNCGVTISSSSPNALINHIGCHSEKKRFVCSGCSYSWAQFHQAYTHTKRCPHKNSEVVDHLSDEMLKQWLDTAAICFPERFDEISRSANRQLLKIKVAGYASDLISSENHDPNYLSARVKAEMFEDLDSSALSQASAPHSSATEIPDPNEPMRRNSEPPTVHNINPSAAITSRKRKISEQEEIVDRPIKAEDQVELKTPVLIAKRRKPQTPSVFTGTWEEHPKYQCASCEQQNDLSHLILCLDCDVIVCGLCAYKKHKMHDGRELLSEEIHSLAKELETYVNKSIEKHINPLFNICNESFELHDEIKSEMSNLRTLILKQDSWNTANEKAGKCRKMIDNIGEIFAEFAGEVQKSNKRLEEVLDKLKSHDFEETPEETV